MIFFILTFLFLITACNGSDRRVKYSSADDGMLLVDGKRTFIIGSYHLPKVDNPYQALKEAGYNYVHVSAEEKALDSAQKKQLKTWITTGYLSDKKRQEDEKRITQLVQKFKSHPALLCWEIADEPAFTWNSADLRISPRQMIDTYRLIKKLDSAHPIYTNHAPVNLISTLQKYNPATDIIACDVYPVIPHGIKPNYALFADGLQGDLLNPYISQVGEYTEKMKQVADNAMPVFMVLQGFAWEILKPEKDRDPAMIQYPTFAQLRFMAYDAIVHGATGILYWGASHTPQPSPFMNNLNKLTRELADLQEELAAPKVELELKMGYVESGHSIDTGVKILAKKVKGVTFLFAVNGDKNPVQMELFGLKENKQTEVLTENRALPITDGVLTDRFEPFDVHIYQLIDEN